MVIAVIALLIGILLPRLRHARDTARSVKELSNISQAAEVNASHSLENADGFIPVRILRYSIWWNVCDSRMYPADPVDPTFRITREAMRTWPWRLVGYPGAPSRASGLSTRPSPPRSASVAMRAALRREATSPPTRTPPLSAPSPSTPPSTSTASSWGETPTTPPSSSTA
ncbi:MAG: hypothetical protein IT433_10235 [Phycisphaerales bacterium]|nr:hypothetical protein [Phycisphaerales bacterium]